MCVVILLNELPSPLKENTKSETKANQLDCEELVKTLQTELFNMEGESLPYPEPAATFTFNINQTITIRSQFQFSLLWRYH